MKYIRNAQNKWYKWQDLSFEPWDEDADVDDRCCLSSPRWGHGKIRQTPCWVLGKNHGQDCTLSTDSFISFLHCTCTIRILLLQDLVLSADGAGAPSAPGPDDVCGVSSVGGVFCALLWVGCHPSVTVRTQCEEPRGLGAGPDVGCMATDVEKCATPLRTTCCFFREVTRAGLARLLSNGPQLGT